MMNEQHKRQTNNIQITSIYMQNRKLRMENQMVRAIPNRKLQKN